MNLSTLARRSLFYHARSHLGAVLGSAVAAAVLIGALVVGDSVRGSLRQMALARLGKVDFALASNDRLFTTGLATNLHRQMRAVTAAVLQLPGSAVNSDSSARANNVQILGVADDFWKFSPSSQNILIPPDGVILNAALAKHLSASVGDSVLLRVQKPSQLSQDAPLARAEDHTIALRLNVDRIVGDDEFGRFGLRASQIPPFNAFVNREVLQRRAGATNKNNLLLLIGSRGADFFGEVVQRSWTAADAELDFRITPDRRQVELRSSRIFLDPAVAESIAASTNLSLGAQPIFTYFVNQIQAGEKSTPYSMVTAMGTNLGPGEISINQWLADDLAAKPGDQLSLAYYIVGPMRRLTEERATFTVKSVIPIQGLAADRSLMPDFPGLPDAKNCRDWDTGFPIKTDSIREKDEQYWDDHRGTPKAFISLPRGQQLWGNRFGDLTAIRWNVPDGVDPVAHRAAVEKTLLAGLNPASVGLRFEPVRAQALAASVQGQDFGELFLSFSFFLIAAALMLMTLLFGFGIERRAAEMGLLLAIGLKPKQVRQLLLLEGAGLAILGTLLGLVGGVFYAQAMLAGLSTIWQSAVGTSALQAFVLPKTVATGAIASVFVAIATIAWSIRKEARRPARELLSAASGSEMETGASGPGWGGKLLCAAGFLGAFGLVAVGLLAKQPNPGLFFGAGALLLIGAISAASLWMRARDSAHPSTLPSLRELGLRNIARRRKRSRAVLILLSAGAFMVAAVGVFRLDSSGLDARSSGTGAFAFIGESALPIVQDLNSSAGRDFYSLSSRSTNLSFIPLRVRAGDDASCLNLNMAQKPRLLGVDPDLLLKRGAFTFSRPSADWGLLSSPLPEGVIPAIGDAASIQWALKAKLGDTIDYQDERGRGFKIQLVGAIQNSILQGSLVIAEKNFIQRFPTEAGYRMFLIDAPSNLADEAGRELTRALQDYGLELTRASDRLAAFNAVQNTYISTFQVLGGLGLLLGSFGLGVVVLRNVFERRAELALLQAVGFTPGRVRRLILGEHAALLAAGLLIGAAAAIAAVLPQLIQSRGAFPLVSLGVTLAGVVAFGLAATWAAGSIALRGNLLNSLRSE